MSRPRESTAETFPLLQLGALLRHLGDDFPSHFTRPEFCVFFPSHSNDKNGIARSGEKTSDGIESGLRKSIA